MNPSEELDVGQEGQEQEPAAPSAEQLQEAKALGWSPKENWRGDPADWIDAAEFLERGKSVMPLLKSNNDRLQQELRARDSQMAQMAEHMRQQTAALKALEEGRAADELEEHQQSLADLEAQIEIASENGQHREVARLTRKMIEAEAEARRMKTPAKGTEGNGTGGLPQIPPEVIDWFEQHPKFKEPRVAAVANAIAAEMRQKGDRRQGAAFLNDVAAETEQFLGVTPGAGSSRTAGGNGGSGRMGGGGGSGGSRSYADMPSDAREACDRFAKRVVGQDKKFKDINAWRSNYAREYFAQEQ